MGTVNLENPFISWNLSDQERIQGTMLTTLQKQCIQNQIAGLANEKINLTFDPDKLQQSFQQEAELQGQIKALQYLLVLSNNAEVEYVNAVNPQEN